VYKINRKVAFARLSLFFDHKRMSDVEIAMLSRLRSESGLEPQGQAT
jgi:hypothetical protein